jgi:hypothetical protein
MSPPVVMRPTDSPRFVNHSAPSGPAAIAHGSLMLGSAKFVTAPAVVIRPIELLPWLVNQSAPSEPLAPCVQ